MEILPNNNLDIFLKPGKILENSDYTNWLYDFSLKHKTFSDDPKLLNQDISDIDKENLRKLPSFISALEYVCLVQNVSANYFYIHDKNVVILTIYFEYKGKRFVITKETSSLSSCKVSTRPKTEKNKHKYIILDKVFH